MDHFAPLELPGVKATPERTDGRNVQDAYCNGRIAAEIRLWEALENGLSSSFHYFDITDKRELPADVWTYSALAVG
ncbi:hypothetical protein ABZ883_03115 [Streptomyces sp. NPDC046977]|uniref:hypothetical protein n=1 Tax=Streptomyces sp. NPDC046977 TaxID=3154703 RepID=UPI0033DE9225